MDKISYKNKIQKDSELYGAYQKGINDERKVWKELEKKYNIMKYREHKRNNNNCFCMGDSNWKKLCAECQDVEKEIRRQEHQKTLAQVEKLFISINSESVPYYNGKYLRKEDWEKLKNEDNKR